MEIQPKPPTVKAPAETFTGDAWFDVIARGEGASRIRVNVVRFAPGQLPPVNAFWSLTMYGSDLFLVDNPLGRYSLGDRSSGLERGRDGSLRIVISHRRPSGPRGNWLPAPSGRFVLALRLYNPKARVLSGRWPFPRVKWVGD